MGLGDGLAAVATANVAPHWLGTSNRNHRNTWPGPCSGPEQQGQRRITGLGGDRRGFRSRNNGHDWSYGHAPEEWEQVEQRERVEQGRGSGGGGSGTTVAGR